MNITLIDSCRVWPIWVSFELFTLPGLVVYSGIPLWERRSKYVHTGPGNRAVHSRETQQASLGTRTNLTNFHWFSFVWTLIYHDLRHHIVNMLWTHEAQPLSLPSCYQLLKENKTYYHWELIEKSMQRIFEVQGDVEAEVPLYCLITVQSLNFLYLRPKLRREERDTLHAPQGCSPFFGRGYWFQWLD
jgi:hypothetical protein